MAVKISIGLSDEQMLAQLAKQKASWEKNEKAADDFGKSAAKAERMAVSHGKRLVKQHRSAEQALKDRVAALDAAAKQGDITDQQRRETIAKVLAKHREAGEAAAEAARKGTKAYKDTAAAVDRGKNKVRQLVDGTKTLAEKNRELKRDIVSAYKAGEVSVDEMKASIRELNRQQVSTKKTSPFGDKASEKIKAYALGVASVSTAIAVVRKSFEQYLQEVKKGRDATIGLRGSRTNILQVSDETNFQTRLGRIDKAAVRFGVDRDKTAEALFDAISNEVEEDFEAILRADRVIPAEIGAKFVGEFRKVFKDENLTADQALNLGLSAAGTSSFNVQTIQPQIRTAAQGAALLPGVDASDVAAFVSVLGSQFGDRTGTTVQTLEKNIGSERIRQVESLKTEKDSDKRIKIQRNIDTLSKGLVEIIRDLNLNDGLRESVIGGNNEVLQAFTVATQQLEKIQQVDQAIERDTALAGTENSPINRRLETFFQDPRFVLDVANKQAEISREISAENRFSLAETHREFAANRLNVGLNQNDSGILERSVANAVVSTISLIESTTGLGQKASLETSQKLAQKQIDELLRSNQILEKIADQDRPLTRPNEDQ